MLKADLWSLTKRFRNLSWLKTENFLKSSSFRSRYQSQKPKTFRNSRSVWHFKFHPPFCGPIFGKKIFIRSQVCRTALIRSALESTDPAVSNGASIFEIQPLGADLVSFEVTTKVEINWQKSLQKILNYSVPGDFKYDETGPRWLDLGFPASVLRIKAVRHIREHADIVLFREFLPRK